MRLLIAFALIIQAIFPNDINGQSYAYNYTQYDIEDGLPSSETYFAYQDEEGYMWFTTDRGIVKYDGYEFTTFTEADGLAETVNFMIHKDPRGGFITIGKEGKITEYRDGEFKAYHFNELASLIQMPISHLHISCISKDYILFVPIYFKHRTVPRLINKYYLLHRNNGSISEIKVTELNKVPIPVTPQYIYTIHNKIDSISSILKFQLNNSNLYFLVKTATEAFIILFESNNLKLVEKLPNTTNYIQIDKHNRLWISSPKYITVSHKKINITEYNKLNILNNIEISSCYEDVEGNLWLMTSTDGIIRMNTSSFIKPFPSGNLNNRIIYLYKNNNILKIYSQSSQSFEDKWYHYLVDSFLHERITDNLFKFYNDTLIQIKDTVIINKYKNVQDHYDKFGLKPKGSPILNIQTNDQYYILDQRGNIIVQFRGVDSTLFLDLPHVNDFHLNDSMLYVGTSNDLYTMNLESTTPTTIKTKHFINDRVNDVHCDNKKGLWVATLNKGLFYLSKNKLTPIKTPGLKIKSVNAIHVSHDSLAYIGTPKGIYRVNYSTINDSIVINHCYSFTLVEGINSPYITGLQEYQNNLYIGTLKGLYYFNIDSFNENSEKPKMYIDEFKLIESDTTLDFNNTIYLKYSQNNIQLSYTGIYYLKNNAQNFYRYKLNAISPSWQYTNNRSILFSGLAPGDYTFTVQCRNNSNVWSDPATVKFSIAPHYTQTWLFRIGVVAILAIGVGAFFYLRNQRLQREQELKNEILRVKMQSTRSQMNPHFVFNGMNAIQNFIFKDEKRLANRYISTFSSLIRDSLKMSEMNYISLDRETNFIEKYLTLEKERFPDKFDFEISVESPVSPEKILVPPLMVQTLAENSVKHAFKGMETKGKLEITYKYDNIKHHLYITVVDNGVGLDYIKHQQKANDDKFGLNLLQRRLNIYNQKSPRNAKAKMVIEYLDEFNQTGTLITLIIPLNGNND